MSDKELIDLIHNSVFETFDKNLDGFSDEINSIASNFNLFTQEQSKDQSKTLLRYTMFVSEISCIAMAKTLASLGILSIPSTDNEVH